MVNVFLYFSNISNISNNSIAYIPFVYAKLITSRYTRLFPFIYYLKIYLPPFTYSLSSPYCFTFSTLDSHHQKGREGNDISRPAGGINMNTLVLSDKLPRICYHVILPMAQSDGLKTMSLSTVDKINTGECSHFNQIIENIHLNNTEFLSLFVLFCWFSDALPNIYSTCRFTPPKRHYNVNILTAETSGSKILGLWPLCLEIGTIHLNPWAFVFPIFKMVIEGFLLWCLWKCLA